MRALFRFLLVPFVAVTLSAGSSAMAQDLNRAEAVSILTDVTNGASLGGDWYYGNYLGTETFLNFSQLPYIYSQEFGWAYVEGDRNNLYTYSFQYDVWVYTNTSVQPFFYIFGLGWIDGSSTSITGN